MLPSPSNGSSVCPHCRLFKIPGSTKYSRNNMLLHPQISTRTEWNTTSVTSLHPHWLWPMAVTCQVAACPTLGMAALIPSFGAHFHLSQISPWFRSSLCILRWYYEVTDWPEPAGGETTSLKEISVKLWWQKCLSWSCGIGIVECLASFVSCSSTIRTSECNTSHLNKIYNALSSSSPSSKGSLTEGTTQWRSCVAATHDIMISTCINKD